MEKALFKLYWPTKLNHYDKLYNLLITNDGTHNTISNVLNIYKNNLLNANIYPIGKQCPSRWIKYYAPNIGQIDKSDSNHMFPFVLDIILKYWPCIELTSPDINHPGKLNVLIYFYGELLLENKMISGCFEYIINGHGTLFHRLFRSYSELPINIMNIIINHLI